jgi:hypothetical protein
MTTTALVELIEWKFLLALTTKPRLWPLLEFFGASIQAVAGNLFRKVANEASFRLPMHQKVGHI